MHLQEREDWRNFIVSIYARFYSVLNYVIATSALRQVGQYVFNAK